MRKRIELFKQCLNLWLLLSFLIRALDSDFFYSTHSLNQQTSRTFLNQWDLISHLSFYQFIGSLVVCCVFALVNYFKDRWYLSLLLYLNYLFLIYVRTDSIIGADSLFFIVGFWNLFLSSSPKTKIQNHLNKWILRTILIQLCLIYLVTALTKLESPIWQQGVALHYILNVRLFDGPFHGLILKSDALLLCLAWLTIFTQISFPFFILNKKTKYVALLLGLFFHLGSIVVLSLYKFILFPIVYVLFWDAEEFRDWAGTIKLNLIHLKNEIL
jgi:hypothetical protein